MFAVNRSDMEAAVSSNATENLDNKAAYGKIAARPKNRRNKRKGGLVSFCMKSSMF